MDFLDFWTAPPPVFRRACSGFLLGLLGGGGFVGVLFTFDVAHLRSLAAAVPLPLSADDLLTVPLAFAALGIVATGLSSGCDPEKSTSR